MAGEVLCLGSFAGFCCPAGETWTGVFGGYDGANYPYGPEYKWPAGTLQPVGPGTDRQIALSLTQAMNWWWKVKRWLITPNFTATSTDTLVTDPKGSGDTFTHIRHHINSCNTPFYINDSRTTMLSCMCGRFPTGTGGSDGSPLTIEEVTSTDILLVENYLASGNISFSIFNFQAPTRIYALDAELDYYYPRFYIDGFGLFSSAHGERTFSSSSGTYTEHSSKPTGLSVSVDGLPITLYQTDFGTTEIHEEDATTDYYYTYEDTTFTGSITITPEYFP